MAGRLGKLPTKHTLLVISLFTFVPVSTKFRTVWYSFFESTPSTKEETYEPTPVDKQLSSNNEI